MGTGAENKAAVRACFDRASRGAFDTLHEILDADFVLHPEEAHGVDGLAAVVERYRSAIDDLSVTIDQQFTEGDHVATRFTIRGNHGGELMGVPPTGKSLSFTGITVSRCRDGKIVEEWELVDSLGLLDQIGGLREPAAA